MHAPLTLSALLLACAGQRGSPVDDTGDGAGCPDPRPWYADVDGDGYGAGPAQGTGCEAPEGQVANDDDCDDADPNIHPAGTERCNGVDDDCDGDIDPPSAEGAIACWLDRDGDGFGDPATSAPACACPAGEVENGEDCDDGDPDAWPGATEVLYDGVDQACDGPVGEYDGDGDGHDWEGAEGAGGDDCDDTDATVHPDAWEDCEDDVDQDCDGSTDECGLASDLDAGDAWVRVFRDPGTRPMALFSDGLVHAGDADGDGRHELLGHESRYSEYSELKYKLMEIPWGSEGDLELGEVTVATWTMPKADRNWLGTAWSFDAEVIAGEDLDGDGLQDYLFLSTSDPLEFGVGQGPRGRIDLWSGPGEGEMSLDDAVTVEMPVSEGVFLYETMELLHQGEGPTDLVVASLLWPLDSDDEGSVHKGIALLTLPHLLGATALGDATAIWTSGEREVGARMEAGDLDGDGIDELVSGAQHYRSEDAPSGRVWVFQGPIEGDRSLDDAELIIVGEDGDPDFGYSFALLSERAGDGPRGLVVTSLETPARPSGLSFFRPAGTSWPTTLRSSDAQARIDGNGAEEVSVVYMPRMVGDLDADGVEELGVPVGGFPDGSSGNRVLLVEPPTEGVHGFDLAETRLDGGPIDVQAGFGVTLLGGVDYDGDTWSDLVVGEYYWDDDPDLYYAPYGRYLVYRGEVGAR